MEMNFEFTDVGAERGRLQPSAAADLRAADSEQQADAGQQLHGATSAERLDGGRDHDALAERGDVGRAADPPAGEAAQDRHTPASDMRQPVRLRLVDAINADGHQDPAVPARPADRPESASAQLAPYPDHVRVFQLTTHAASDAAGPRQRHGPDTASGDHDDHPHETGHEDADTTAQRFVTDMSGRTTVENGDSDRDHEDVTDKPDEAGGVGGHEKVEYGAEAEGDGKNAVARKLGGVLRVTGKVLSDVSGKALDAYRNGPGERMLDDQLERSAERVGRQALRDQVRAAKRDAPILQRRYAANNIKYHAGVEIIQTAKRDFKERMRASWREIDEAAARDDETPDGAD